MKLFFRDLKTKRRIIWMLLTNRYYRSVKDSCLYFPRTDDGIVYTLLVDKRETRLRKWYED